MRTKTTMIQLQRQKLFRGMHIFERHFCEHEGRVTPASIDRETGEITCHVCLKKTKNEVKR